MPSLPSTVAGPAAKPHMRNRAQLMEYRWALVPLGIFSVTRVIAGILLHVGAGKQVALTSTTPGYHVTVPTPESPGYLGVISNWDGQWYRAIAENGYPPVLPEVGGDVVPNEWAFSAGYPLVVRLFMALGQVEFPVAATIVSLLCGAVAMVILYGVVRDRMDDYAAATLVLALNCFPSAPVFQVAYTESMTLLLVVLALRALARRDQGWFVVWAAVLSVTRPVLLPLGVLAAGIWVIRWRRRAIVDFPQRERVTSAVACGVCLAMVGVWPTVAALVTGNASAFTDTIAGWPSSRTLGGPEVNFLTLAIANPVAIGLFVFPVLALVAYAALRRPAQALPEAWRWWAPLYMVYMFAATKPSAGILRYILIAIFPLAPLLESRTRTGSRADSRMQWIVPIVLALAGIIGQYYWVTKIFTIDEAPALQPFP
jgi:hypothetical protein